MVQSPDDAPEEAKDAEPITFRDIAPATEFSCWVVVALAPFLRWVNGAAVTDDQFVIQVTFVSVAALGATGLRFYNWRHSGTPSKPHNDERLHTP